MNAFQINTDVVAPLDRFSVDTDAILPKQFLKRTEKKGFGKFLFYNWRYNDDGTENAEFFLNQPEYRDSTILLARDNFGCGSSREHAAWSLADHGFKVILAPSFADIFYNNAFKNGILLVELDEKLIDQFFQQASQDPYFTLTINVEEQFVEDGEQKYSFDIDKYRKEMILGGYDEIDMMLKHNDKISTYEKLNPPKYDLSKGGII